MKQYRETTKNHGTTKPCLLSTNHTVFNSLGPSDALWRQRSGSTLAQVMACCLTAPIHYLNQCWLIISNVQWHSSKGKFTRDTSAINHCKIKYLKFHSNFPGANELIIDHVAFATANKKNKTECFCPLECNLTSFTSTPSVASLSSFGVTELLHGNIERMKKRLVWLHM